MYQPKLYTNDFTTTTKTETEENLCYITEYKIWKYNTFLNSGYVWLEGVWMVYFSNYPYFTFIAGKVLLHAVEAIKSTISLWRSSSVSI